MNDKITTDIISTTGINITKYSSAKVFINGVEITDTESWNKAISTFNELQDKINNLQSKIDKVEKILKYDGIVEDIYYALCMLFGFEYYDDETMIDKGLRSILKED